jgi:hypothetical protein
VSAVRVSIKDAALVVGLPSSKSEFDDALTTGSDFLGTLHPPPASQDRWSFYDSLFASTAREVESDLHDIGVMVLTAAKPETLRIALSERKLVGVVGHHPLATLAPTDVSQPERILDLVEHTRDPVMQRVRSSIAAQPPAGDPRGRVAAGINALIEDGRRYYDVWAKERDTAHKESVTETFAFSRIWFDVQFEGLLQPGPCVELGAATATISKLVELFRGFRGAVDLMVCNSVLHADRIKRENANVLFLAGEGLTAPAARMKRFQAMMLLLARHGPLPPMQLFHAALKGATEF